MRYNFLWIPVYAGMTILLFLGFTFTPVFAHVLKTDGNIGAVVHINPEDDPIAGEKTTIYFDVKDKEGKFSSENCLCIFKVSTKGQDIYMQTITGTVAEYTFPARDMYTLELKGTPKYEGVFTPFTLTYDVRVERVTEINNTESDLSNSSYDSGSYLPYASLAILVIIAFVIYKRKSN